ncbi:MAG: Nif3-like dinuclear metal center hexameric protein, partial [Polaribacter sp.]
MKIQNIIDYLEELAPLEYAEDFDNVGLLIGNYQREVTGILVTLDTLEETVEEAIIKKCNLIVSFHPIIFNGLKKINGNSYVERVVLKAIKNDIAIYATHTALDNSKNGVSAKMCAVLGLQNTKILIPKKGIIKKLTTYAPVESAEKVRQALFTAGTGNIGNYYSHCSFYVEGNGTYKGNQNSNPILGEKGKNHTEKETKISVIFESKNETAILKSLQEQHPYEEVAYEIVTTEN